MVHDAEQKVGALEWLDAGERRQVLEDFNATQADYPHDRLIHQLFEAQVLKNPEAEAVVFEGQVLSYGDLNRRSNQLAHTLRHHGVGPDVLVAICVERSLEMVVGLLGILKAGGAYVPIDPAYPAERIEYMLTDAAPRVVLTQTRLKATLPDAAAAIIALDTEWPAIAQQSGTHLDPQTMGLTPQHLAYVIYTSGSTGQPKGVAMSQGALTNLIEWHRVNPHTSQAQRTLQFAALGFDVAFQEIFATLCVGGVLVLVQEAIRRDPRALLQYLREQTVQRVFLPFIALQHLAAESVMDLDKALPCLEDVITAGEQLRISPTILGFFQRLDKCRLHNHYGPTESHVVTALTLDIDPDNWSVLPAIGCPIANTRIYLLDADGQLVPIGVAGEIHIAGAGVARGYLNRPELTAERFITDPFSTQPDARLYKTGDLGRWRADGNLEYLGRNDHQVKIRGFRIELGEIEAQLSRHPQVKEAVVLAREDHPGDKRLVAYLTVPARTGSDLAPEVSTDALRTHLKAVLPEYMIPSAFLTLETLPLTPNGKLDRKALPAPDQSAIQTQHYEAPQGEIEETLAAIWQDLLHLERVGRHDHFFDLGGHSLLAVQVIARIRHVMGRDVALRDLFEYQTIKQFAGFLLGESSTWALNTNPVPLRNEGNQRPLFFVHEISGDVLPYVPLARLMKEGIPIYGLQATGLHNAESPQISIEAMAAQYVEAIRRVQPYGPYRLAGWSAGGVFAYEIASQLIGDDESVEFLGMIDTYKPDIKTDASGWDNDVSLLLEYVCEKTPMIDEGDLRKLRAIPELDVLLEQCQQAGFLPSEVTLEEVRERLKILRVLGRAYHSYCPQPIQVPITLFTADDLPGEDPSRGWGRARVGEQLHFRLIGGTHQSIMEPPYIQRLADAIGEALEKSEHRVQHTMQAAHPSIITIQTGKPGASPIFCVPGAGANVTCFLPLAHSMGEQAPIYGLQPRGLDGVTVPHSTVSAAARAYIDAIRKISPNGPYRLIGHSFGGWVVFEMALQLVAAGEVVDPVVVLDADPPSGHGIKQRHYSRIDIIMELIGILEQASGQSLCLAATELECLNEDEQLQCLLQRMVTVGLMHRGSKLQTIRGMLRVFATNINTGYIPAMPFPGKILLVQAQDKAGRSNSQQAIDSAESIVAWQRHAPHLTVLDVLANHMTLLESPNIDLLAPRLLQIWDRREEVEFDVT